jgi:hypothetical protein
VRALDRDDGEEVDGAAGLGDLDDRGETGEASSDDDDAGCGHCYLKWRKTNAKVAKDAKVR